VQARVDGGALPGISRSAQAARSYLHIAVLKSTKSLKRDRRSAPDEEKVERY
jgi:hypothetical protein